MYYACWHQSPEKEESKKKPSEQDLPITPMMQAAKCSSNGRSANESRIHGRAWIRFHARFNVGNHPIPAGIEKSAQRFGTLCQATGTKD